MSKKRARFEKAWRRIEAAAESGEPVEGSVIEVVKGGLIIDLGVRGFLPASLVDIRRVQNLDEFLGQTIECKVIELNRSRNNVVLSRRAVLEEERKEVRQQILDRLQPGQVVEGAISNIVDFGAFVDLDGIDGLIHISELSWSHVNHPSEILSIGDVVPVKVLDIDRDRQRISLGLKQTQEDPWQRVVDTYNLGDELEGKVTKVVSFGAFVEILDGVEGLVHISELANHHVENPREVVNQGDVIRVKILEIDSERRRLSLSAKRVEDQVLPRARGSTAGPDRGRRGRPRRRGRLLEGEVRDLGLSEDVFVRRARPPRRRPVAGRAADEPPVAGRGRGACAAEAEAAGRGARRGRGRRGSPRGRAAEAEAARRGSSAEAGRRRGRRRRGRRTAEADAPRGPPPRPRPPPTTPRPSAAEDQPAASRPVAGDGARVPFVGLTGGIAAGKSEALKALERLGAATLSSDAVVHELLDDRRGARPARRALRRRGRARTARSTAAAVAEQRVRRRRAAQVARGPAVAARRAADRRLARRARAARDPPPRAAVVEVPLLFEAGMEAVFDATIAVVADEAVREERAGRARPRGRRVAHRRGSSRRTEKSQRADYTVRNDGTLDELERAVGSTWEDRGVSRGHSTTHAAAARASARSARAARAAPRAQAVARRRRLALLLGGRRSAWRRPSIAGRARPGRGRRAGDHAAAAPRGHHPPAGRRQEPRPGADRGGHLPGVEVPGPHLARGRARG